MRFHRVLRACEPLVTPVVSGGFGNCRDVARFTEYPPILLDISMRACYHEDWGEIMRVYIVTNTETGEQYVGRSIQAAGKRWYQHVYDAVHGRKHNVLARAILRHGAEAFVVVEFIISPFDPVCLDDWERLLIEALSPAYNQTTGGTFTEVTKPYQRIAGASHKGRGQGKTLAHRQAIARALRKR
jgi:hypothetical protein